MIPGIPNSGYRDNENKPAVTWTNQATVGATGQGASRNKHRLVRGAKYWVLVTSIGLFYSDSLSSPSWTQVSGAPAELNRILLYGGGYYVTCNVTGTNVRVYNEDLTEINNFTTTASWSNSVCGSYFPDSPGIKYIYGGTNSVTGYIHSSNPTSSWSRSATPAGVSSTQAFGIGPATASGNTQLVASHGSSGLYYGANGAGTVPTTSWGTNPFASNCRAITYANGTWVLGGDGGEIATSPGNSTSPVWTIRTSPFAAGDSVSRIIYVPAHNMWVASSGDNGGTTTPVKTAYSTDNGQTWAIDSRVQTGSTNSVVGLDYGENGVLARAWNNTTTTFVDWSW